jgi:SAM-dependent methyltransferase
MRGCRILCLASGGGQQAPIFAAAGAVVTVLDNSPAQLERDREVGVRHALAIRTVLGDMADLSCFPSGSFDLVFHPVSNVFAPDVGKVWKEAARVLREGGVLLAGFNNPVVYIFDQQAAERGELRARHPLPYSDVADMPRERLADVLSRKAPLEYSHTLQEQIGGQCDAGFAITGMYEDHDVPQTAHPLDRYMPLYIATRAVKYGQAPEAIVTPVGAKPEAIDSDLPCVRCGYNLRTLGAGAKCPECGAAVQLTMELGKALQQSRPAYLGRLAVACWILFVARFAVMLAVLLAVATDRRDWLPPLIALGGVMYAIGTFVLTGREHPQLRPEMPEVHLGLRLGSALILIGVGLLLVVDVTVMGNIGAPGFLLRGGLINLVALSVWCVYSVCPMLEMPLLVRLSRRVSDASLREHAIIAGIGATVSGLTFAGFMLMNGIRFRRSWSWSHSIYVELALLVALLLFWIWTGYASLLSAVHLTKSWDAAKLRWRKHAPVQA